MTTEPRRIDPAELLAQMDWVRGLARSLVGDPAVADDVAQDTWLVAVERPPRQAVSGAGLRAWLAAVTRSSARHALRSEQRRRRREHRAARSERVEAAADVVERGALQQRLAELVMQLDEPVRSTVLYRYVDGLPAPEIAARLGVAPAAVRKRLSRGVATLRQRLAQDERGWDKALAALAFAPCGPRPVAAAAVAPRALAALACLAVVGGIALWWGALRAGRDQPAAAAPAAAAAGRGAAAAGVRQALPAVAAAARRVLVADADGNALVAARVAWSDGRRLLAVATTDRTAELEVPAAAVQAFVSAMGCATQRLALAPDATVLALRRGASLVGTLDLVGADAGGVALAGESDLPDPEAAAGTGATAPLLRDALRAAGVDLHRFAVVVGSDGRFAVRGLPAGWFGRVQLPLGCAAVAVDGPGVALEDAENVFVRAPTTACVVRAVRVPVAHGDAVLHPSGAAAVGQRLWLRAQFATGQDVLQLVETDAAGRWQVALEPAIDATLRGWAEAGGAPAVQRLEVFEAAVGELGEPVVAFAGDALAGALRITLAAGVQRAVQVVDALGAPVAGAEVRVLPADGPARFATTGPDGRAVVARLAGTTGAQLEVRCEGYLPHAGVCAADADTDIVKLARAAGLIVQLPAGCEDWQVTLEVAEGALFDALPGLPAPPQRSQTLCAEGAASAGFWQLGFWFLRPGAAATLVVRDAWQDVRATLAVRLPPRGVWQTQEIAVPADGARGQVHGVVQDADGRALPRCAVALARGAVVLERRTNAQGRFRFPDTPAAGTSTLTVRRAGFAPWTGPAAPGRPQTVTLAVGGDDLVVTVRDATGATVRPELVWGLVDGVAVPRPERRADGSYRFRQRPSAAMTVWTAVGDQPFQVEVPAGAVTAVIDVPAVGSVTLDGVPDVTLAAGGRLVLVGEAVGAGAAEFVQFLTRQHDAWLPQRCLLLAGRYRFHLEERIPRRGGPRIRRLTEAIDAEVVAPGPTPLVWPR